MSQRWGNTWTIFAMVALIGPCPAYAQAPSNLPGEARTILAEIEQSCRSFGGRVTFNEGFVQQADFNGDGKQDYVIDWGMPTCSTASAGYCGSAGCMQSVYISNAAGYLSGVDFYGLTPRIRMRQSRPILTLDVTEGSESWGWTGKAFTKLPPAGATAIKPSQSRPKARRSN
ncbi:hypothetical protein SAMN05428950_102468 [Sphingomonas sp. OV641]|uniref:hypothetical protein n=1 Tax=Sphingomonas sp. OV641 TaxID=1881068 RepID=UPI0008B7D35F|nr:hypothetical protein [Sphingomonas sp. OV641]SEJ66670.1 hypothetical protein SAMN05428950_102468 [Sphingomonas sp. OV641]